MPISRSCAGVRPLGRWKSSFIAGEGLCAVRGSASLARVRYAWPADPSKPPPGATMPVRSMTAYASAERTGADGTLACELRAVNHRFLEVGMRLPDELRALEPVL